MDIKIEINEEDAFSEVNSQTEKQSFPQDDTMKLNTVAIVCKTEIKEEAPESDICAQNEWGFLSENIVIKVNECSKYFELDTKIEVKEELWEPETTSTEAPCVDNITKDCVDEIFPPTESIRLNGEVSRGKSVLISDEDPGKHKRFHKRKDNLEREDARKYKSQKVNVPEISSIEYSVHSEHDSEEMDSRCSCLKQSDSVQRRSVQQQVNYKKNLVRHDSCKYRCGICDRIFLSPSGLRRHKFNHEGKKPHKCSICDKSFAESSDLKIHNLIHEGQKPHKCDLCGKCFTQLSNLKTHKMIHEGKKPHRCEICEKAFTRLTDLRRHKLIHEGVRPHKCDICGNSFTHLSTLKTHKMIHEGKKTLKCNICGNGYTQLPSFLRHKLIHDNKKPLNLNTG